ncbi:MAG: hypothetical protein ACLPZF_23260, partial [Candidatus Acidiferrales bacterium]
QYLNCKIHRNLPKFRDSRNRAVLLPHKFYIFLHVQKPNWQLACTVLGHLSESVLHVVCCVVSVGLGLGLQVLKSNASGGLKV